MINIKLDLSYVDNSITTAINELRFKYNTQNDYFYFDLYKANGDLIRLHNKVVTGYNYKAGITFSSSTSASFANIETITSFTANIEE